MKNTTEVNTYYDNVSAAAKTLEEYYERMAKFTSDPERAKKYNEIRREMRDLWKTHESYSLGQTA
jgi:CHASE3 domain sensor protein